MTHLLCSDGSVNAGMNLEKKMLQAKYSHEGLGFFFPFNTYKESSNATRAKTAFRDSLNCNN